jgi:hypothetical protein
VAEWGFITPENSSKVKTNNTTGNSGKSSKKSSLRKW